MKVEYFFDCSSPWTYLSFTRIEIICATHGAELVWNVQSIKDRLILLEHKLGAG